MGRTGEIRVLDKEDGRVLISNNVPYGSYLKVKDGRKWKKERSFASGILTTRLSCLSLMEKLNTKPSSKV
jgi:hypothetical protein